MSTYGNTISAFSTWLNLEREQVLTSPEKFVNEAVQHSYLWPELMRSRDAEDMLRPVSGKYFTERILIRDQVNGGFYSPGDDRNPTRVSNDATINIPLRFMENPWPFTEPELEQGEGDEYTRFKSYRDWMMASLRTRHINLLESAIWAVPNQGDMEAGSTSADAAARPGAAYSIPTFITEGSSAGASAGTIPPASNGTFTTIQGLNPVTVGTAYQNPISKYDTTALDDENQGLFAAFDDMMLKLKWVPPAGYEQYMENDDLRKLKICTNKNGRAIYQQRLRSSNDLTRSGPQDPSYGMPQFMGFPVAYISQLDSALLEQNPIATYTTAAYPDGRPRYFFINCRYIVPVFKANHFFSLVGPTDNGTRQRDAKAYFLDSWWNLACRSRPRGGGIVRPLV